MHDARCRGSRRRFATCARTGVLWFGDFGLQPKSRYGVAWLPERCFRLAKPNTEVKYFGTRRLQTCADYHEREVRGLPGASCIVNCESPPNPGEGAQATERSHRPPCKFGGNPRSWRFEFGGNPQFWHFEFGGV